MDKSSIILYPFSCLSLPIALYLDVFQPQYSIDCIVTPEGTSLAEFDISRADNRPFVGKPVLPREKLSANLEAADALLIAPYINNSLKDECSQLIENALSTGKRVLCADTLRKSDIERFYNMSQTDNFDFQYFPSAWSKFWESSVYSDLLFAEEFEPFVIFVGGLIEESANFEISLAIASALRARDINTSVLVAHQYGELFGLHSIHPSYIDYSNYSNSARIELLNKYMSLINMYEHPQVFIVQIPSALMRYNAKVLNGFGVDAFLYFSALRPDCFICNIPFEAINSESLKRIDYALQTRLGVETDFVHVNNIFVDRTQSQSRGEIVKTFVEYSTVSDAINQYNSLAHDSEVQLFSVFNQESIQLIVDKIVMS